MRVIKYTYTLPVVLVALVGVVFFVVSSEYAVGADAQIKKCNSSDNKPLCYTTLINSELSSDGVSAALDTLAAIYIADPDFSVYCHGNTHDIGKAAYQKFKTTGQVELSSNVSYCGFGFYHGFMEALTAETKDYTEMRQLCTLADHKSPFPRGVAERNCYHGIGHGTVDGSDPYQWGNAQAMLKPALALCDYVATSTLKRGFCYGGAFNAIGVLAKDKKYKLNISDDPYSVCRVDSYTVPQKEACYVQLNLYVNSLYGGNFAKSVGVAMSVPNSHYRSYAVYGVVWDNTAYMNTRDSDRTARLVGDVCGRLPSPYDDMCVRGVVQGILKYGTPGGEYKDALAFCKNQNLQRTLSSPCFSTLSELIVVRYRRDIALAVCGEVPEEYKGYYCTYGFEEAQHSIPREFEP